MVTYQELIYLIAGLIIGFIFGAIIVTAYMHFRRNQKMSDYYVEVLVKRDVEKEKKKRKIIMIVAMAMLFGLGIATKSQLLFCLFVLSMFGYYFLVQNYCIEFEYFYMDKELVISKIVNKSRRKKILELNDGAIKLTAPINSTEMKAFNNLDKIDCTANELSNLPYAIVYKHKGALKIVKIQMNDELYKELKRDMPYKVKDY